MNNFKLVIIMLLSNYCLDLFSQDTITKNLDTVKVHILGFESNTTYQFLINTKCYEFKISKYGRDGGVFYSSFPESFNKSGCYIYVRSKKKYSLKWQYCELWVKNDSTKKFMVLYRDNLFKTSCFQVKFINDIYPKAFGKLYADDSHTKCGPTKVFHVDGWW
ncbi:MAG: hypothetical protein WCP69_08650 [Bacteroidota bacterium]